MAACLTDGSGFGPCRGETTPAAEACATIVDDDCDGLVNEEGADCACVPGSDASCYSGPAGTDGVGICQAGTQTCNADGTGFGPCTGETLPQVETCLSPEDEDCDGAANEEGSGCVCVPGTVETCYSGPSGTQGVGACTAGEQTCDASGLAFGACVGEVTPAFENCTTSADEDCDGLVTPCGAHIWSKRFGAASEDQRGWAVATDGLGNVYLAGQFSGDLSFGGPTLSAGSETYSYLAKLDPLGNHIWSRAFPSDLFTGAVIQDIAVTATGDLAVLVMCFGAVVDLGGGVLPAGSPYDPDVCAARYDASGDHVWSVRFVDENHEWPERLVFAPSGDLFASGNYVDSIAFSPAVALGPLGPGNGDLFVVKLEGASGSPIWARSLGGNYADGGGLAVDSQGRVGIASNFRYTTDLGSGPVTSGVQDDAFLSVFDATGVNVFVNTYPGMGDKAVLALAADPAGNWILAGRFAGDIDLGGGKLLVDGEQNVFVAKVSPTGSHLASKRYGQATTGVYYRMDADVDPAGNIYVIGSFQTGSMDFGGGPITPPAYFGAFWAKLDPDLGHVHSRGAGSYSFGDGIAADPAGNSIVVGDALVNIDLGGGPLPSPDSATSWDIFVAKFAP